MFQSHPICDLKATLAIYKVAPKSKLYTEYAKKIDFLVKFEYKRSTRVGIKYSMHDSILYVIS